MVSEEATATTAEALEVATVIMEGATMADGGPIMALA